ncbi:MAG: hypothetical protein RSC76_06920 [Oscillospiraceae bacterium]
MTTKMTKRDKMLLYVMSIVLVAFGFIWFLILPQLNRSAELELSVTQLESQKLPMEAAVMGIDGMNKTVASAKAQLEEKWQGFYPKMENYQIDKILTGIMIEDHHLRVENLSISATPVRTPIPTYGGGLFTAPGEKPLSPEATPEPTPAPDTPEGDRDGKSAAAHHSCFCGGRRNAGESAKFCR